MHYLEIKKLAGRFRNNPTKAEKKLWNYLKGRQLSGRKFLRQHPIVYHTDRNQCFFFIPDFYCDIEKLVIELDGGVNDDRHEKDIHREIILQNLGLRVIRFRNEELSDIKDVMAIIQRNFRSV
jgi:very-short-patch-repair endonuclease